MLPIFAARAGTMPCQPMPPWRNPGTSWILRGSTRESWRMPGTVTPWKRTGENSITRPVQLISQPTTPVKTGTESRCSQSTCWKNQSISSSMSHRPLASGQVP